MQEKNENFKKKTRAHLHIWKKSSTFAVDFGKRMDLTACNL